MIPHIQIISQAVILSSNPDFSSRFEGILKSHHFQVEQIFLKKKSELPALVHSDLFLIDNESGHFPYLLFFQNLNHHFQKSFIINFGIPPPADVAVNANLVNLRTPEDDSFPRILTFIDKILHREKLQLEFSSMLLHDIRSPLNSMIGYLELLISGTFGKLEPGHRNILEKSIDLGDQTLDLLEELSDVYMFEQGAFIIEQQSVDLTSVTESVLRTVWVKADHKNIKISKKIPPELNYLLADEFQIQRLLLNVLMNAISYSPENSSILLEVQPFENNSVRVSVKDTGRGIPETELPHLFKKYYRFPQKKNRKGHGLGLYICKVITEAHGGKIWAENEPKGGLAIHFTLPLTSLR